MSITYANKILLDTPKFYYRCGEPVGTQSLFDASVSGASADLSNGGDWSHNQTGAIALSQNAAIAFGGTSGSAQVDPFVNLNGLSTLSVECWIKVPNTTNVNSPRLIASDLSQTSKLGFDMFLKPSAAGVSFFIGNGTVSAGVSSSALSANVFYHVVGTWNGTTITLYLNGVSQGTASLSGPIGPTFNRVTIAKDATSASQFFNGTLDEIAVYTTALTSTQVLNHYNTAISTATAVYQIPNGTRAILADDVNQVVNILQAPSGFVETTHYFLAGNGYTSSALIGYYIPCTSRTSVPVSVTTDTSTQAATNYTASTFSTSTITSGGCQVFGFTNGAQINAFGGGLASFQF